MTAPSSGLGRRAFRSIRALTIAGSVVLLASAGWALRAESPTGSDLLSVPVRSSQPREHSDFNRAVARASVAGEAWVRDPLMVVRRFSEWGLERTGVWVMQGAGERPSRYKVTAVADGFLDDSVRGERLDVAVERGSDESWRIAEARASRRCWRGRARDFQAQPCP